MGQEVDVGYGLGARWHGVGRGWPYSVCRMSRSICSVPCGKGAHPHRCTYSETHPRKGSAPSCAPLAAAAAASAALPAGAALDEAAPWPGGASSETLFSESCEP